MEPEPRPVRQPVVLEPLARVFVDAYRQQAVGTPAPGRTAGGSAPTERDRLFPAVPGDDGFGSHPDVAEDRLALPGARGERNLVRIVRPTDADEPLPVILYIPGPIWTPGAVPPQRDFERDLVLGTDAAVVVLDTPQQRDECYPETIERLHAVLDWIAAQGAEDGLDPRRIAVVGVSTGANLAAGLTLLAKRRGGPEMVQQVLICPATDAAADTPSYREFAEGYFLDAAAMTAFWDRYVPDAALRTQSTASPSRATGAELEGLPPTLIVTAEADVLRDEGEAYAARLRAAGVAVVSLCYHGTVHGFVAFDALRASHASTAARIQVVDTLHVALHARRG
ncbi:alpha/beta hydrolase [Embleya sp. NPDC008237]|uniref:alpha/beta hydrolase n=1 Tax=Embleya sp. NPDC008237 TaxID=3363978 RepID=UPI0036E6C735